MLSQDAHGVAIIQMCCWHQFMQTRSKCANCCQRIHLCALFALHVHTNYADTPVLAICLTRCGGVGGTAKLINPALAHLDSSQEIAHQLISVSEKARALNVGLDWSHIINVYSCLHANTMHMEMRSCFSLGQLYGAPFVGKVNWI